jgi:hypothetical protein
MVAFNITPQFSYLMRQNFQTLQTTFESGVVQTRAKWPHPIRQWELVWSHANADEMEKLRAFYRDHNGPADTFTYTPVEKVPRPYIAATLSQQATDTTEELAQRTLFVGYTWADNDTDPNETEESVTIDSVTVAAGNVLVVTPPAFPNNVDQSYIYVGLTSSTLKKQSTPVSTSGSSWTEPGDGYDSSGDAPPTANGLSETVTAHFQADSLEVVKNSAYDYSMRVVIEEII